MNTLSALVHCQCQHLPCGSSFSFFGQVNAEAAAAFPSAREERVHNDSEHDPPQALQPAGADKDTLDAGTNKPVVGKNT